MKKQRGILVVSYGSSYKEEREKGIGGIETAIGAAFPEYKIYRAFTSKSIVERIEKKEGLHIDSISEALDHALLDGMRQMVILQTHLVQGVRYEDMKKVVDGYKDKFEKLVVVEPVLSVGSNVKTFVDGLVSLGNSYDDGETAVCFVGHGIDAPSQSIYEKLQREIDALGYTHFYIGTLSMKPSLEDLVVSIQEDATVRRIVLVPLMLVSGYHVRKDLAGVRENTWTNTFLKAGYAVECIKRGLGEERFLQNIFVEYLKNVILIKNIID